MPSRGRNCYSLLRLKLISRSPLWLGSNIVTFHPGGPCLIPDIKLIYALIPIVKVISSIILISLILHIHICRESSKYYMCIQPAVPHGLCLPAGLLAGHHTDAASKLLPCYCISVHFLSRWSCASTYVHLQSADISIY